MSAAKPSSIHAAPCPPGFRVVRPGARYAVRRVGDGRPGAWLADDEALPRGWADILPEDEARLLLPFLRTVSHGRRAAEPTTADGKFIARAKKILGLTAAQLGKAIGAHESVISRAVHGELPAAHRDAIKAMIAGKSRAKRIT